MLVSFLFFLALVNTTLFVINGMKYAADVYLNQSAKMPILAWLMPCFSWALFYHFVNN